MKVKVIMVRVLPSVIAQQCMFSKVSVPAFSIHAVLSLIRTRRNNVMNKAVIFSSRLQEEIAF